MSIALQELPTGRAGDVADLTGGLHARLDELAAVDFDLLAAEEQGAVLASIVQGEAKMAGLRLAVLASAERSRAAAQSGAASTAQWAARIARSDPAQAHRQVALARGLEHRSTTQKALSAGAISTEHAAVIVQADRQLPRQVTAAQRSIVEAALVEKAQVLSPTALRRAARRALEHLEADAAVVDAHENELVATEEARARARTRLTLHENGDGTVSGHFTLPVFHGHLLRKILETITAPRRGRLGASQAQLGDQAVQLLGVSTDWDRARGEAFCELIEHLPTDHLHPKTAATLVVTIEHDVLQEALRVAHLDTGEVLSAGEARRLACNARLLPAVLGGPSLPLDLGRSARLFTEAQRTALGIKYQTCAAEGCERPYAWTELHHEQPWSHGGHTDLACAIPFCCFHHQRIHDPHYRHTRAPDGTFTFHRRT